MKTGLRQTYLALAVVALATVASADTNAPAFRFHPELSDMSEWITTPTVLTNSPLLAMSTGQVSNCFAKAGFYWMTNDVAKVYTGYIREPRSCADYVWERWLILTFNQDKIVGVEVVDRPGASVSMEE